MTRRSRTNVDSYGPIKGRTIPMDTLDTLIGSYLEERLLAPDRLSELLAGLLKRRAEHVARQKTRIADLKKQAADAEAKLTRLYEAIENGLQTPRGQRQATSRPTYCRDSLKRHVNGSRQMTAVSGDITCRRWCSAWRSEHTKSGLRDQRYNF